MHTDPYGRSVVLLHGWPGGTSDYRRVTPLLPSWVDVVVPDLYGFGDAFEGPLQVEDAIADAHARRVLALIDELALDRPVVAGYDIGSRIAQALARGAPERVRGLVVTPGYPGIGQRASEPEMQPHFWYQHFHRLPLAGDLLDGNRAGVERYLRHFWATSSSAPGLDQTPEFEALVDAYSRPGAFRASLAWYDANRGYAAAVASVAVPTTVLWPDGDPVFPVAWADRIDEWFDDAELVIVPGSGHFVPLEAPELFAGAIRARLAGG